MRVALFGSSALTLRAAQAMEGLDGIELAGLVHAPPTFAISFAPEGFTNSQHADIAGWATTAGLPSMERGGTAALVDFVSSIGADLGLVVGWHHNLSAGLLRAFRRGVAGVHASLLPDLRGHAPLPWAILTGRKRSGVSLFVIDPDTGVDEGAIYGQRSFDIGPRATIATLLEEAAEATSSLLSSCLPEIAAGTLRPRAQVGPATYGLRRGAQDGWIDWTRPATELDRLVRAVTRPYPGAITSFEGNRCTVWAARDGDAPVVFGAPGQIALLQGVENPVVVTGAGWLELLEVTTPDGEDLLGALRRANHLRLGGAEGSTQGEVRW